MTFRYPAVFQKKEDGSYTAYFPDLAMCTAKGNTLDDCINDAIAECRDWIQTELLETLDMPPRHRSEGERTYPYDRCDRASL